MSAIYPDLAGMPVLVTGGASGIGEAIVAAFAAQRARVAAIDIDGDRMAKTAARIAAATGTKIETCAVDLRDIAALRVAIAELAARTGPFKALVNNAGDDARHPWRDVTPELWDDRFAVNARHQFFAAQAVAPAMADAGGGAIVNLGSISWMFGAAGLIAYTTAKSAIMGLTKSLARELGGLGIRVNSIAPGWVLTEKQIARANADDPAKFKAYLDRQCLKEHLAPDDVAKLVLWLASAESRRCSGQTFVLDAGVV
jgi:NAD(P)-dependent dehydrogenase (short-subunit alcohol dehydrogenase family)